MQLPAHERGGSISSRCLIAAVAVLAATQARAQVITTPTVPPGFAVDILTQAVLEPTSLAFLPDGRILVSEQRTGAIKVWAGGSNVGTVGIVPGVESGAFERGLLSIAVDPQWPARPYVYAWFDSNQSQNMRLAMYPVIGNLSSPTSTNLALGPEYAILTDVPDLTSIHNGGSLRFGPDGTLYVSIGDDANGCAAQDINSSLGCILRMSVGGLPLPGAGPPPKSLLIPSGNPFSGPTDTARLVWCHGLRNPFRFHIDPLTGTLHIAEVGAWLVDELDVSSSGGENFGWPWYEAGLAGVSCGGTAPQTVHPIASLPHWTLQASTTAVMSGGRYRNTPTGAFSLGPAYEGDYFYLEYFSGMVRRLKFNGNAWVPAPPAAGQPNATDWGAGFQSVVDTAVGPDGAIYFVKQYNTHLQGALGRIRSDPNASIVTAHSGDHQAGNAGQALGHPLVVRVTTSSGAPIAGQGVTFAVTTGGGSVSPPTVTTDAQGYASTSYTLASTYTQAPTVAAIVSNNAYAVFHATWRGINVVYNALGTPSLMVELRHSETNSAFTLVWDVPPSAPYGATPFGEIWTNVLSPWSVVGYADGLGLYGTPDAQLRTGPTIPYWGVAVPSPALPGGVTLVFQGYAIDTALFPAPESIMISNAPIVTIP